MHRYNAKDFARVGDSLRPRMPADPELLIHRNVRGGPADPGFAQERGAAVFVADIPSEKYSVTFSEIAPFGQKRNHRHSYDAITIFEAGEGYSVIEGRKVEWKAGDVLMIPVWAWHQHFNPNPEAVRYVTFENAPELLNSGLAVREEA